MKKLVALAAVASLVVGGQALAQVDAGPDGLGMFFDRRQRWHGLDTVFYAISMEEFREQRPAI